MTASQVLFSWPEVSEKQDLSIYVYNFFVCSYIHFSIFSNRNTFLTIDKRAFVVSSNTVATSGSFAL